MTGFHFQSILELYNHQFFWMDCRLFTIIYSKIHIVILTAYASWMSFFVQFEQAFEHNILFRLFLQQVPDSL